MSSSIYSENLKNSSHFFSHAEFTISSKKANCLILFLQPCVCELVNFVCKYLRAFEYIADMAVLLLCCFKFLTRTTVYTIWVALSETVPLSRQKMCRFTSSCTCAGCAVRLETRRSRVQPLPRSATFFHGD